MDNLNCLNKQMVRISYDTFLETKELVKQIEEDEQKLTYMEKAKLERLDENKMKCDFFNLIIERQDKRIFEIKEKILSGRQYLKMFRSSNL